ncbi:unnamed protein product [Rotaria socialis]|uniref:Uncharacterized protein n=1 Tax=Rotaria socialis TaxID=392032 RepID=A0A819Z2F7_9BILA|nr:unnamed protein product [Rotaria socialis]CAF4170208.1 unnamed protein product [Rotaria socialis]
MMRNLHDLALDTRTLYLNEKDWECIIRKYFQWRTEADIPSSGGVSELHVDDMLDTFRIDEWFWNVISTLHQLVSLTVSFKHNEISLKQMEEILQHAPCLSKIEFTELKMKERISPFLQTKYPSVVRKLSLNIKDPYYRLHDSGDD